MFESPQLHHGKNLILHDFQSLWISPTYPVLAHWECRRGPRETEIFGLWRSHIAGSLQAQNSFSAASCIVSLRRLVRIAAETGSIATRSCQRLHLW